MIKNMDYEEFLYWQAMYFIRPFGDDTEDLRAAIVCSTIHNNAMGQTKGRSPSSYLPYKRKKDKEPTMMQKVKLWQQQYQQKG